MNIIDILNSNGFQTLITFTVGLTAFGIYFQQKRDYKQNAAKAIVLEIQNAEKVIARVRDSVRNGRLEVDQTVMLSASWNQHKHLFSKDFDKDEWDEITEFYNKSRLLDEAIKYNSLAFANDVDQIRANKQRVLADYAKELLDKSTNNQGQKTEDLLLQFNQKLSAFDQIYMNKQGEFAYAPQKPINDAKIYLEDLKKITTSSLGTKLKRIAKM